ncbi:MAG TPA: hypothetical protein VIX82_00520 [Solirubrobacteraceae bacterium]
MKVLRPSAALATATATACMLAAAPSAEAVIQVQRGISGIAIGMSAARVNEGLGTPSHVTTGTNDFGPFTQFLYPGAITVTFQGNANVTAVSISSPTDRTVRGVGIGSTLKAVKHGVPGVRCQTFAGVTDCMIGKLIANQRVTDFMIRHGRVTRVTIAIFFP